MDNNNKKPQKEKCFVFRIKTDIIHSFRWMAVYNVDVLRTLFPLNSIYEP